MHSTFVPYSTQEGFGIGCDFVQFGIPDLRIRRLREEVHLTDLHIMPHIDRSPPGWLGSKPNSSGFASPSFPPPSNNLNISVRLRLMKAYQAPGNSRVNFLVTCFRACASLVHERGFIGSIALGLFYTKNLC